MLKNLVLQDIDNNSCCSKKEKDATKGQDGQWLSILDLELWKLCLNRVWKYLIVIQNCVGSSFSIDYSRVSQKS